MAENKRLAEAPVKASAQAADMALVAVPGAADGTDRLLRVRLSAVGRGALAAPARKATLTALAGLAPHEWRRTLEVVRDWDPARTNLRRMFLNDLGLFHFPAVDTSAVASLRECFYNTFNLASVAAMDTSSCADFNRAFYACLALSELGPLDVSRATDMASMCYKFASKPGIRRLRLGGFGTQRAVAMDKYTFGSLNNWTDRASLLFTLLNNSFDRAAAGYPALEVVLSAPSLAVLSASEKAQIAAKGYTLTQFA